MTNKELQTELAKYPADSIVTCEIQVIVSSQTRFIQGRQIAQVKFTDNLESRGHIYLCDVSY